MKRKMLMTSTAAALIAAPTFLSAESPQASTGTGSEVASQQIAPEYDTNSPAISNGDAEADPRIVGMDSALFTALANARGTNMETTAGETVGLIERVNVNAQGNPELVVDLIEGSEIPAEVLVVTVQPGNVTMVGEALLLDVSMDELEQKARYNSGRDSDDRVQVTLF